MSRCFNDQNVYTLRYFLQKSSWRDVFDAQVVKRATLGYYFEVAFPLKKVNVQNKILFFRPILNK